MTMSPNRQRIILGIVDAVFVIVVNVLTLVLVPEQLPFALGLCAVLQPVVVFLVRSLTQEEVARINARF